MGVNMESMSAVFEPQSQAVFNRSVIFDAGVIKPDMTIRGQISELGERIQNRLDDLGLSARKASELSGLSTDAIRNIMRKPDSIPRGQTLLKLAKVLQVSPQYLLTGEDRSQIRDFGVRFGGTVEAGAFRPEDGFDQDAEFARIQMAPDPRFPQSSQYGFRVAGDSMTEAKIFDGMYVLAVEIDAWERVNGELGDGRLVVVARTKNGDSQRELTVKRLRIFRDRVELRPESKNPRHEPVVYHLPQETGESTEVQIIAVVLNSTWVYA